MAQIHNRPCVECGEIVVRIDHRDFRILCPKCFRRWRKSRPRDKKTRRDGYAPDPETLIYADTMGVKTKHNLLVNSRMTAMAILPEQFIAYQVKGTFKGFETSGRFFEMMSNRPEYFFNVYFGVRAVGIMGVEEVYSSCPPLPGRRMVPPETYLKIKD